MKPEVLLAFVLFKGLLATVKREYEEKTQRRKESGQVATPVPQEDKAGAAAPAGTNGPPPLAPPRSAPAPPGAAPPPPAEAEPALTRTPTTRGPAPPPKGLLIWKFRIVAAHCYDFLSRNNSGAAPTPPPSIKKPENSSGRLNIANEPMTDQDFIESEVIRRLLSSYFEIVRKKIVDSVPKVRVSSASEIVANVVNLVVF